MLSHCSVRRAAYILHRPCRTAQHHSPPSLRRRTLTIEAFTNGFLDLATALPLPPSLPPYSTTIIICTVVSRFLWTVPFSIWAKRRQWRAEEEVLPIISSLKPGVSKLVLAEMQRNGVRGTKDQIQEAHAKRVKQLLTIRRKQLLSEHHCSPGLTMAIPLISQLPLFIGCSIVLNRLSQAPTPFDSESFLTLSTLAHADPTAALPIALGLITLANVESSRWFVTEEQRDREEKVQKWKENRVARGETVIEPQKIIKSALRLVSVGRIVVATMVPGGVVLYWVTSAAFGLVQTWVMDYWELLRKRKLIPFSSEKTSTIKQ